MKKYYQIQNKSFGELGVSSHKELWDKVKETHDGISVDSYVKFKPLKKGFHADLSSPKEDRHGDIVHQDFDVKAFKNNPVLLDSHNYGSIQSIIGKVSKLTTKNGNLEGDIEFMQENPLGALAHKMVEGGYLNAVSIGFIPKAFGPKGEILKSELLELSVVSVPAQAEALFKAYEDVKRIEGCPYESDCEENSEEGATEQPEDTEEAPEGQPEAPESDTEEELGDDIEEVLEELVEEDGEDGEDEEEEAEEAEIEEVEEDEEEIEEKKLTKSEVLRSIAKELQKMSKDNFQERRRKLFKQIREELSQ